MKKFFKSIKAIAPNLEFIFSNKVLNYGLTATLLYFVLCPYGYEFIRTYTPIDVLPESWQAATEYIAYIFIATLYIALSIVSVEPQTEAQVLILGMETGIWLDPGYYFLPFSKFKLIGLYEQEIIPTELRDIDFLFTGQDSEGKEIKILTDGTWGIGDDDDAKANYEHHAAHDMHGKIMRMLDNIESAVFRTKEYFGFLSVELDLCDLIMECPAFKNGCKRLGIKFIYLSVGVKSGNIKQDDINAQATRLARNYEKLNKYTPEQIMNMVQTQLKLQAQVNIKGDPGKTEVLNRVSTPEQNH